ISCSSALPPLPPVSPPFPYTTLFRSSLRQTRGDSESGGRQERNPILHPIGRVSEPPLPAPLNPTGGPADRPQQSGTTSAAALLCHPFPCERSPAEVPSGAVRALFDPRDAGHHPFTWAEIADRR